MVGESVSNNREPRNPKRKWHFPHGFMVGIMPVGMWAPALFAQAPEGRHAD